MSYLAIELYSTRLLALGDETFHLHTFLVEEDGISLAIALKLFLVLCRGARAHLLCFSHVLLR